VTPQPVSTFVFDSTNGALWAEEVARRAGIGVEVVPAPAGARALCHLAIAAFASDAEALEAAWADEGVPYRPWTVSAA
jgi:hypothetical protein